MKNLMYEMRLQEIGDEMLWKKAAIDQEIFMRDAICMNMLKVPCFVVSWHTSKSIHLPVYGFIMQNGVKVIARYNFYDWKLSVKMPDKLPDDYLPTEVIRGGLKSAIPDCYLEGFRSSWAYGVYKNGVKKFTIELSNRYDVYMICFLLNKAFPAMVFDLEKDERSVDEIADSIQKIYEEQGAFDIRDMHRFSTPFEEPVMSGWEILWRTNNALKDAIKNDTGKYTFLMDECEDPKEYAKLICKYPEGKRTFLMEEYMFNASF